MKLYVNKEAIPLYTFSFFMIMPMHVLFPLLPMIRDEVGASYSQISIFLASLGIVRIFFAFPSGFLADRFNQKNILLFSGSLCFAGLLVMSFAHSFYQLLVSRILIGFGSIVCTITILALLAQLAGSEGKGIMMSMNNVVHSAAGIVSPALAGFLAKWYNWRVSIWATAGLILFSGLILAVFFKLQNIPKHKRRNTSQASSSNSLYQNAKFWLIRFAPIFVLGFFVFFYRGYFRHTILPFFGKDVFGIEVHTLGLYFSLVAGVSMISLFVLGTLSDRRGRKTVLLPGIFFAAIATIILLLPQPSNPFLMSCVFLGLGAIINSMPNILLSDLAPPNVFGRVMGLNRIFADSGYFSGSIFAGILLDHYGFKIPLYCICGYAAGMMLVTSVFIHNHPTSGDKIMK
jgi:predicted MFS family arabinose efflux permease